MKLKAKLTISHLIVAVLSVVIISIIFSFQIKKNLFEGAFERLSHTAEFEYEYMNLLIEQNIERLKGVSSRTQLRISLDKFLKEGDEATLKKVAKILDDANRSIEDFAYIKICSLDGKIIYSTNQDYKPMKHLADFLPRSKEKNLLDIIINQDGVLKTYLAGPLIFNNEIIGGVVIELKNNITDILTAHAEDVGRTGEIILAKRFDEKNIQIISPRRFSKKKKSKLLAIEKVKDKPLMRALRGQEGLTEDVVDYRGNHVMVYARYFPKQEWGMIIKIDLSEIYASITDIIFYIFIVFLVIVLLAVLLSFIASRNLADPLIQLTGRIKSLAKGEFDRKVPVTGDEDEVTDLGKEFNNMLDQLKTITASRDEYDTMRKKAETAAKAKSDFLANMSHEIRTPMNAILGFSHLLEKTPLSEKQKSYIHSVQSSGKLLIGIIDDILDISKLESGKINLEIVDFNLEETIHDVFQMVVTRMKDNPFDTYVDIAEDVPAFLKGDPTRIKQVFVNLLGNAIKFTTDGEIGVLVKKAGHQPFDDKLNLHFTVKDTGVGIAKDKQAKIFESFSQADESTTRKFGGTGLGLTITKALVEAMGGQIWVESEVDQGSEFIFTLPLEKSESTIQPLECPGIVKDKTVFIVDDNQTALKIIERCCVVLDLKVIGISASPQEALHKLDKIINTKGIVPDIILSDIIMEGMSGFQMVAKIKANDRFNNTVFIAVTADINAETHYDPNNQLFNAYVIKPVSAKALTNAFRSVLGPSVQGQIDDTEDNDLSGSCKGIKVLVVEDVMTNQILIEEYFHQLGCEGKFAENGQQAIDQLKESTDYNLCLMDLQMPVMGGVEATKIIRKEISKDLPIIALTAAVLEEDKEKAEESGMNGFLAKPIDIEKLKDIILKYR